MKTNEKLDPEKIKKLLNAYLNQRGVVELKAFATALGIPRLGSDRRQVSRYLDVLQDLDAIITPLLPHPACRVEMGERRQGKGQWEIRYYLRPRPPLFQPAKHSHVLTVDYDPTKATWTPESYQAQKANDQAKRDKLWGNHHESA